MSDEEDCNANRDAVVRDAWRRSRVTVVDLLEPDTVLDQFLEAGLFGESTRLTVRDIREAGNTSTKNRALHDCVSRDPRWYVFLKESLVRTRQMRLLDLLEKAEITVHDEMIGEGRPCFCSSAGSCQLIQSLQCRRDLSEFVPNKVKEVQRKLIETYENNCLTVPVFALIPEVTASIERLYVTPNMQIVDIRGKQLGLNSQACRQTNQQDLTVKTYQDIFYKDNKACKNIYITGDAGIGKSAFCESMVQTWCRAHARLQDAQGELSDNEQVMKQYPILFYISLRYALEDTDIDQMIEHQLGIDNVSELLESENCLVVLDGLDEWTAHEKAKGSRFASKGLPKRSLKGNYTVVTTSRPWKLEKLRLGENEIDNQVNIKELTEPSFEELSERILTAMNKTHGTRKSASDFFTCLEGSVLHDQLKTPVIMSLMVCLWYYGIPFGNSECEIYSNMIDKQIELAEELKDLAVPGSSETDDLPELPGCFETTDKCNKYRRVLISLSKLACDIWFQGDRESSLVFDHKDTEISGMSPSELDICLKIGILTQQKVFVNFIKRSKTISFIHKTHQEFFAALHLAMIDQESAYSLLKSKEKRSLDALLDMSKVILFLNGMNGQVGNAILSHVRELACEDQRVEDYRRSCIAISDKNYPLVHRVQNLIIDCESERRKNGLPTSTQQIDDLEVSYSDRLSRLIEHWDVLRPINAISVTFFVDFEDDIAAPLWSNVLDCARGSKDLQKLYIACNRDFLNIETAFKTVQSTCLTLRCLVLVAVNVSSLGERFRDMLTMPRLHTLGLGDNLYLTHDQIDMVSGFLQTADYIEELRLKMFRCLTHSKGDAACKIEFDVSSNTTLRRLFLMGHVDKISINPRNLALLEATIIKNEGITKQLLECIKGSAKVMELELHAVFRSDIHAIVDLIPAFEGLRKLRLLAMNLDDLPLVLPPTMVHLEHVLLRDILLNNSSLRHMLDNLPAQRVEIWMGNVTINQDDDAQFVKDYIRTSDKFEVTLDDPTWMYFHTIC